MAYTREEELIWHRFHQLERVEKGLQAAMSSLYVWPHASQEAHARDEALRAAIAAAQKLLTERQEQNNAEHDALQAQTGHRAPFVKAARKMGLEGKPTATHAGDALAERLSMVWDEIGPMPHAALDFKGLGVTKKQGTRMLKACCPDCGYLVRLTRQWASVGLPDCPADGSALVCDALGV